MSATGSNMSSDFEALSSCCLGMYMLSIWFTETVGVRKAMFLRAMCLRAMCAWIKGKYSQGLLRHHKYSQCGFVTM
jgi:hypothetical protein